VLLAVITLLTGAWTSVGGAVQEAASSLARDPVYVAGDAELQLSSSQADQLRSAIRDGNQPVYIAVLPVAAADEEGGANQLVTAVRDAVGLGGTYVVATKSSFRVVSTSNPQASAVATNALNDHRSDGPFAVMLAFVKDLNRQGSGAGSGVPGSSGSGSGSGSSSGGGGFGLVVVGLLVVGGFLLFRSSNKRRQQERTVLLGDQEDLRADLSVLADDVMRLEPEVAVKPEARDDYEAGVARYKWALAAVDSIDSPDDIPRVRRGMAEAQYAMSRARAIVQGRQPPEPPTELQQPGPYGEPAVQLDDARQPVYVGYGGYGGGWGGGGFFGGNGLFTGLILGQMLGGGHGWGGGFGWGGGGHEHGGGGFGGWGGDGGGGGLGIGGGDWGGGGGGGGDIGGGDW
jgi:hypothetical protein